ncbi:MAG: single-stranded DNA-binding protein [Cyanobacteria bacterium P01_H01_bin.58]
MNHCMLMAEITVAPQIRYTQDNQTPISEFTVMFPGLRPEEPPQQMKVIGWGNLAQEIQERYQAGDRVLIEGRLAMNTVDRPEGFKEKQAELTAQKISRIADLGAVAIAKDAMPPAGTAPQSAPQPSAAPVPAPATPAAPPAASEAEVDYDDIPF